MEIDITAFVETEEPSDYSASWAELGDGVGTITWNAAMRRAAEGRILDTEEKLDAMRAFARSSGGWDAEEIARWSADEVNALFVQWVAGDMRDGDIIGGMSDEEWAAYEARASEGQCSANIFRGIDGRIYFSLDS